MNKSLVVIACAFFLLSTGGVAVAHKEFHGIVESRPDGKVGTWVVAGRSVEEAPQHTGRQALPAEAKRVDEVVEVDGCQRLQRGVIHSGSIVKVKGC